MYSSPELVAHTQRQRDRELRAALLVRIVVRARACCRHGLFARLVRAFRTPATC